MEEIYVVKVRTEPDPARLYPSERRYSALTVGGLGAVHLLLAATSLLLGCLGLALQSDSCWTGRYGGGLWLGIAAAAAGAAGMLAWRRWYVDNNIRWFFISSTVAATTSLLCLIITAAALAAIQEEKSNQELYRSIYYGQGFVKQQDIHNQPIEIIESEDLPSLSLQRNNQNDSYHHETQGHVEEVVILPSVIHNSNTNGANSEPSEKPRNNLAAVNSPTSDVQTSGQSDENPEHSNDGKIVSHDDHHQSSEKAKKQLKSSPHENTNHNENTEMPANPSSLAEKPTHSNKNVETNSEMLDELNNEKTEDKNNPDKSKVNRTKSETTHIMRISNTKPDQHVAEINGTNEATILPDGDLDLEPVIDSETEHEYNRSKKSAHDLNKEETLSNNNGNKTSVIEDEYMYQKNKDVQEVNSEMTSSIRYEVQDVQNVPERIHNDDDINQTIFLVPSPKQKFKQDEPQYERIPKAGREVRTVVAINILVASALELAWSLLSASIAWKGMKNCYPHENNANNCDRTVEGLERSPSPPLPPSNGTYPSNKRHKKMDGIFRKPDIISNHRHCHPANNAHLSTVQNKNGINRLHMINTVSERISIEPYLPMEESTMEYQERVHRFLASNNVASNNSDSASNIDS